MLFFTNSHQRSKERKELEPANFSRWSVGCCGDGKRKIFAG
jgi:hypothetical protein